MPQHTCLCSQRHPLGNMQPTVQGRIQGFKMGSSRAQSARKIFGHHAHFTCRFGVLLELRPRILHKTYIIQRDIDARGWADSRTRLALKR